MPDTALGVNVPEVDVSTMVKLGAYCGLKSKVTLAMVQAVSEVRVIFLGTISSCTVIKVSALWVQHIVFNMADVMVVVR